MRIASGEQTAGISNCRVPERRVVQLRYRKKASGIRAPVNNTRPFSNRVAVWPTRDAAVGRDALLQSPFALMSQASQLFRGPLSFWPPATNNLVVGLDGLKVSTTNVAVWRCLAANRLPPEAQVPVAGL